MEIVSKIRVRQLLKLNKRKKNNEWYFWEKCCI
jgi:hypothetical protein